MDPLTRARPCALLFALALGGCGSAADELVGEWVFDGATYELVPRYRELSAEERQQWVDMARMNLTITENRIRWDQDLPAWGRRSAEGAYTVVATKGRRVTVDATFDGKRERFVFTLDEERLRFGLAGRSIILRRSAPAE